MATLSFTGGSPLTVNMGNGPAVHGETWHGATVKSRWEIVTPEMAREWLQRNEFGNRNKSGSLVRRYIHDMKNGHWVLTHQGVAFTVDGSLVDGQHRLEAIAESGVSMPLLVTYGLPAGAIEAIDRGKIRTFSDTLQVLGYEKIGHSRSVATIRAMMRGTASKGAQPTVADLRSFVDQHREAIVFTTKFNAVISNAQIRGVLGRAYYHAEPRKLDRFVDALRDNIDTADIRPGDAAARRLNILIASDNSIHRTGTKARIFYLKAQNALRYYLEGRDIRNLAPCEDDLFPLPEFGAMP